VIQRGEEASRLADVKANGQKNAAPYYPKGPGEKPGKHN